MSLLIKTLTCLSTFLSGLLERCPRIEHRNTLPCMLIHGIGLESNSRHDFVHMSCSACVKICL